MLRHKKSINKLNPFTVKFLECQMRLQPQKPRGRRFTIDDKVFALSLYKQSGKAYKILSKVLALPSPKCIVNLLKKIPFDTGINQRIFENLKKIVQKIKNRLDRYCTVIFDEISLSASLQYMAHKGHIVGFEDLGENNISPKFVDKSLVFMVRGCRKKFKQPVALYLTNSMTSAALSIIIKKVIEAVQSTGLTVISTVCDQTPSNVAAINKLQKNTAINNSKDDGQEYNGFGLEIGNQSIVLRYDAPHLLKGLINNLLTKNLNFEYDGKSHVASWKHIIQFYELNKIQSTEGDRLTPNLQIHMVIPKKLRK